MQRVFLVVNTIVGEHLIDELVLLERLDHAAALLAQVAHNAHNVHLVLGVQLTQARRDREEAAGAADACRAMHQHCTALACLTRVDWADHTTASNRRRGIDQVTVAVSVGVDRVVFARGLHLFDELYESVRVLGQIVVGPRGVPVMLQATRLVVILENKIKI